MKKMTEGRILRLVIYCLNVLVTVTASDIMQSNERVFPLHSATNFSFNSPVDSDITILRGTLQISNSRYEAA
ncbi:hypothetical protein DFS33DRAFT_1290207 [Desarmillaria ectypa]|nr:hypothetical protein DFS33DRAFT_1290207 [Desarmillaria ectypa]